MDWVSSEIEVQEHALAIWRQAALIVLTNDQPNIVEADSSTSQLGKEQGIPSANLIPLGTSSDHLGRHQPLGPQHDEYGADPRDQPGVA